MANGTMYGRDYDNAHNLFKTRDGSTTREIKLRAERRAGEMLGLPGFISPTSNPFPEKKPTELGPRARYPYSFIVCNLFHLVISSSVVFTGENQLTAHKLHLESV